MDVLATCLPDVLILTPKVFGDERGFFYESFNEQRFRDATGCRLPFVQDNHSRSTHGVLRGLHYQIQQAQGKLVRVIAGEVWDVAVDLRRQSPAFGQWTAVSLSAENKRQLWIPPGFAHGFVVVSDSAELLYKTTDYYAPEHERCLAWNDKTLNIPWPVSHPILSSKDRLGVALVDAKVYE